VRSRGAGGAGRTEPNAPGGGRGVRCSVCCRVRPAVMSRETGSVAETAETPVDGAVPKAMSRSRLGAVSGRHPPPRRKPSDVRVANGSHLPIIAKFSAFRKGG